MKLFSHVFYTWFIANLFHPPCWMILYLYEGREIEMFSWVYIFLGGLFLSIPSFLLSWILLKEIFLLSYSIYEKIFLWYLAVIVSILFGVTVIFLILLGSYFSIDGLVFCIPSIASAILVITIRYKNFTQLISLSNKP